MIHTFKIAKNILGYRLYFRGKTPQSLSNFESPIETFEWRHREERARVITD